MKEPNVSEPKANHAFYRKVYKQTGEAELAMHICAPKTPAAPSPAIVFFFGGGWTGGAPDQFFEHCAYFASRGLVAISAEYRVKSRHGATPYECVKDGKSALRWVRAHAAELGIDPHRIAAGGGSAGGHVAACTATINGFEEEDEDLTVSSKPNALVLFNPVIDTTPTGWLPGAKVLGDRAEDLSPAHHVVSGIPPCIIFHGTADKGVPFENVARFCRLMTDAGNTCELVGFEGAGHGFFNHVSRRPDNDPNAYTETVRAADRFLAKLSFLEGDPTL